MARSARARLRPSFRGLDSELIVSTPVTGNVCPKRPVGYISPAELTTVTGMRR